MQNDREYREMRIAPRLSVEQIQALADRAIAARISPQEYIEQVIEKLTFHMTRDKRFPEKVILHEEVLFGALVDRNSHDATCLAYAKSGGANLLCTEKMHDNLQARLREQRVPREDARELISFLERHADLVPEPPLVKDAEDEDSLYYMNLLVGQEAGGYNVTLVTKNEHTLDLMHVQTWDGNSFVLKYPGARIVSPESFATERAGEDPAAKVAAKEALRKEPEREMELEGASTSPNTYIRLHRAPSSSDKVIFDDSIYRRAIIAPYGPESACVSHAQAGLCSIITNVGIIQTVIREVKDLDGIDKAKIGRVIGFLEKKSDIQSEKIPGRAFQDDDFIGVNLAIKNRLQGITLVSSKPAVLALNDDRNDEASPLRKYPEVRIVGPAEFLNEREKVERVPSCWSEKGRERAHVLGVARDAIEASFIGRAIERMRGQQRDNERER